MRSARQFASGPGRGFTLVEVLIASGVLAVLLFGFFSVTGLVNRSRRDSFETQGAGAVLQAQASAFALGLHLESHTALTGRYTYSSSPVIREEGRSDTVTLTISPDTNTPISLSVTLPVPTSPAP